jgi:hypothetical protein
MRILSESLEVKNLDFFVPPKDLEVKNLDFFVPPKELWDRIHDRFLKL